MLSYVLGLAVIRRPTLRRRVPCARSAAVAQLGLLRALTQARFGKVILFVHTSEIRTVCTLHSMPQRNSMFVVTKSELQAWLRPRNDSFGKGANILEVAS